MSQEPAQQTKAEEVLAFVRRRIRKRGKPPSRKQIAEKFEVSVSRVTAILTELQNKGELEFDGSVSWLTLPGYSLKSSKDD